MGIVYANFQNKKHCANVICTAFFEVILNFIHYSRAMPRIFRAIPICLMRSNKLFASLISKSA